MYHDHQLDLLGARADNDPHQEPTTQGERAARWAIWFGLEQSWRAYFSLRRVMGAQGIAALWSLDRSSLREVALRANLRGSQLASLEHTMRRDPLEALQQQLDTLGPDTHLIDVEDPRYPLALHDLQHPPQFLYLRGELDLLKRARPTAVVGSRKIGRHHRERCIDVVEALLQQRCTIISGGALGTDATAHETCLRRDQPTLVVLPCGIDRPTPRTNQRLFEQILDRQGLWLSTYPPGLEVRHYHFARRNQIIAALAEACLLICAGRRSGTLLTAQAALELGRPLYGLSWREDEGCCDGLFELFECGQAQIYRGAQQLCQQVWPRQDQTLRSSEQETAAPMQPAPPEVSAVIASRDRRGESLEPSRHAVLDTLELLGARRQPVQLDDLLREDGRSIAVLASLLIELELGGYLRRLDGNRYALLDDLVRER